MSKLPSFLALYVYRLGFAAHQLRYRVDYFWCHAQPDEEFPEGLGSFVAEIESSCNHIGLPQDHPRQSKEAANAVKKAVGRAWKYFEKHWQRDLHHDFMARRDLAEAVSWDGVSILSTSEWRAFATSVTRLEEKLPLQFATCLRAGGLISQVMALESPKQANRFGVPFPLQDLQSSLLDLNAKFPALANLNVVLDTLKSVPLSCTKTVKQRTSAVHEELIKRFTSIQHKRRDGDDLRSSTQPEVDAEVAKYKADRSQVYHDLVAATKQGLPGAKLQAQNLFGRNAIARSLKLKSKAMVGKSPVWREMATELKLPIKENGYGRSYRRVRVGLAMAEEERAKQIGDSTQVGVSRRETLQLIKELRRGATEDQNAKMLSACDALERGLASGELTDDGICNHIDSFLDM